MAAEKDFFREIDEAFGERVPQPKQITPDFIPGPGYRRTPTEGEMYAQKRMLADTASPSIAKTEMEKYIEKLSPLEKIACVIFLRCVDDPRKVWKKSGKVSQQAFMDGLKTAGYDSKQAEEIAQNRDEYWDLFAKLHPEKTAALKKAADMLTKSATPPATPAKTPPKGKGKKQSK